MAIRYLAVELYRLEKEVDRLRNALEQAPAEQKPDLELQLRQATAMRNEWRARLAAKKETPPYRTT